MAAGQQPDRRWVRDVVVPVLAIRVGLLAIGGLVGPPLGRAVGLMQDLPQDMPDWLAVWDRWDGPHYLAIAAGGYDRHGDPALAAFFPLYPAAIAALGVLLPPLVAAMAISFLATLGASLALYGLVLRDGGDRPTARRAVLAMNLFPTSFVLVAPYAEALFLALSIGAVLAARVERWIGAGFLGFLAALTRVQGWLLVPMLAVEAVLRARTPEPEGAVSGDGVDRRGPLVVRLVWAFLPVGGIVMLFAINAVSYGSPTFFLGQQADHFFHHLDWPWVVIGDLVRGTLDRADPLWGLVYLAPLAAYALLAAVVLWAVRSPRSRPAYPAYVALAFLALVSVTWPISAPRYVGALFPVFLALADLGSGHRRWWLAWLALSTIGLVGFTINFVAGGWAF
jgi:hypothetical protein